MGTTISVIFIFFVLWLINRSHLNQISRERETHQQELDRQRRELELKRLMDLQDFTRKDEILINLQEKVMPERLDTYLNSFDIQFLTNKPLRFDATYYAMLKKIEDQK